MGFFIIYPIAHRIIAEECKKKWKTLRIQQRRIIIKKVKKNERRSAIQWNCYDALKFLIPHMDWTAADDMKKDPDLDMSILADECEDECDQDDECDQEDNYDNEENFESQSEDSTSYSSSQIYHHAPHAGTAAAQADSTNITRSDQQCTVTTTPMFTGTTIPNDNKLNQYLLAYLPTPAATNSIQIRNDGTNTMLTADCVSINSNHIANPQPTMYTDQAQSTTANNLDNKFHNNRILTVPVNTAPTIVNYFLMDIAVQMERLNEIAQMELKIEIHRLLLEKLKNPNNLRQTPSICFAATQNPN